MVVRPKVLLFFLPQEVRGAMAETAADFIIAAMCG
jgi:hypothetical protein